MELLEKSHTGSDKFKEDTKKKKEKKSGMLSGLFRRKDKKKGIVDDDADDLSSIDKRSGETSRGSPVPKGSEESSRSDGHGSHGVSQHIQQGSPPIKEQPNKLQKKSRVDNPSVKEQSLTPSFMSRGEKPPSSLPSQSRPADRLAPSVMAATSSGIRLVGQDEETESRGRFLDSTRVKSPEGIRREEVNKVEPLALKGDEIGPAKVSTEDVRQTNSSPLPSSSGIVGSMVDKFKREDGTIRENTRQGDTPNEDDGLVEVTRLSESPIQISLPEEGEHPPITTMTRIQSPGLTRDTSRQEETEEQDQEPSTSTSSSSSPEMVDAPEIHVNNVHQDHNREQIQSQASDSSPATISTSASSSASPASTPTPTQTLPKWNPHHLLTHLETQSSEIRDLLIVVHDKTGIEPAGPDHPVIGDLFKEERGRLVEMNTVGCLR